MKEIVQISDDFTFTFDGINTLIKVKDNPISFLYGTIYGIFGYNGTGKTTFLNILNTILNPSTGTLTYHFSDIDFKFSKHSEKLPVELISNNIRRSFQRPLLIDEWTVAQNISMSKRLFALENKAFSHDHSSKESVLELIETGGFKGNEIVGNLSFGQRKIVSNLQMLHCQAPLTILDEPFANLHHDVAVRIQSEYKKLSEAGMTIIIVEHKKAYLDSFCEDTLSIIDTELTLN